MRIDRDLWRPHWQEGEYPSLSCPNCSAPLNFDDDSLAVRMSAHNIQLVDQTDIEHALAGFSAWLVCGHSKCSQAVAVSGYCTYRYAYDHEGKTIKQRVPPFSPKSLLPAPPLITFDSDVLFYKLSRIEPIRDVLRVSFDLFWLDGEACANRLRLALELILKDWGFPPTDADEKFITLHNRIDNWHARYGALTVATSLMAIKWLGNIASHETGIPRDRLLDAYEIFSRLLKRLYPPDEHDIDQLADEIVKSKGQ